MDKVFAQRRPDVRGRSGQLLIFGQPSSSISSDALVKVLEVDADSNGGGGGGYLVTRRGGGCAGTRFRPWPGAFWLSAVAGTCAAASPASAPTLTFTAMCGGDGGGRTGGGGWTVGCAVVRVGGCRGCWWRWQWWWWRSW